MTATASPPSAEKVEALASILENYPSKWAKFREAATALRALQSTLAAAQAASVAGSTPLPQDCQRLLPGGKLDDSTYEQIETELDHAGAPSTKNGKWLTLPERVADLARVIAEARAEGERNGIERAAAFIQSKVDLDASGRDAMTIAGTYLDAAKDIRALAPPATGTAEMGGAAHAR